MSSSSMAASPPFPARFHSLVAPWWHTAVVFLVLMGFSLIGALTAGRSFARAPQYALVVVIEWALAAFIWYAASRRGVSLRDLVGGRWARPAEVMRDIGIAIGFLFVGALTLNGLGYVIHAHQSHALRYLLPQSHAEMALWVVMSLTAGFCEELIFRGYFQRQFSALTQSVGGGIVLQGIVFGAGHGYQGVKMMFLIAVYGTMFGLLAQWRRSLRPGMITHGVQDTLGGLLARYLLR